MISMNVLLYWPPLTNVKTDDSGQYKCVAANPAGKVEANFTLQVNEKFQLVKTGFKD